MPTENIPDQDFENIPTFEEKSSRMKFKKGSLFIFVAIFAILLTGLLATAIFWGFNQQASKKTLPSKPTPTPTLSTSQETLTPSLYATDAAILKIEQDVKNLDQELQGADLKENSLNPPALDWQIEFKE
ncbi:hypothetical protein FJZ41_02435 [Candidatus Shapirobacteria bacterium]|nr:hypothetical protein [Candidatus Shapirobacteria bacterium]